MDTVDTVHNDSSRSNFDNSDEGFELIDPYEIGSVDDFSSNSISTDYDNQDSNRKFFFETQTVCQLFAINFIIQFFAFNLFLSYINFFILKEYDILFFVGSMQQY